MSEKFELRCLFFNLAAHFAAFHESNNDVHPITSPNDANNNMENPLDISLTEFDEVANFSGYKSEDLFPEVDLRATELADMEENSIEPVSRTSSDSVLLPNEKLDAGKALFLRVGTCFLGKCSKTSLLMFEIFSFNREPNSLGFGVGTCFLGLSIFYGQWAILGIVLSWLVFDAQNTVFWLKISKLW